MTTDAVQPRGIDVNLHARPQGLEYDAIAARIARDRPSRVLDWGAGLGQVSRRLVDLGLDTTSYVYEDGAAPRTEPFGRYPGLEAVVGGDPVALPFADASFDAVLSCGVLEHVSDPHGSLDELFRVLQPGGRLYVYKLPNRRSYLEAIAKRLGWYYHGKLPDDRVYDLDGARELVAGHGFAIEQARLANMLPLTIRHAAVERFADGWWRANGALAAVPGVRLVATNVDVIATRR